MNRTHGQAHQGHRSNHKNSKSSDEPFDGDDSDWETEIGNCGSNMKSSKPPKAIFRKNPRQGSSTSHHRTSENVSPHPSSSSSAYGSGSESMHQRYDDDDDANDIDSSDDDTMRNSDMIAGLKGGGGGKKRNYRSTAFSNVTPLKNHSPRQADRGASRMQGAGAKTFEDAPELETIASKPDASDGKMIASGSEATTTTSSSTLMQSCATESARDVGAEAVDEDVPDGGKTADVNHCASSSSSSNSLRGGGGASGGGTSGGARAKHPPGKS